MTALEAGMTQIMGGWGWGARIHSFAGWLWLKVGRGIWWCGGGIYVVRERTGNGL